MSSTEKKSFKDEKSNVLSQGRRDVLLKIASGIFAGLVAPAFLGELVSKAEEEKHELELPELPEPYPEEDPLIRMMRDLQKALSKPIEERNWSMVIDLRKCTGCNSCTISCVAENKLPPGVVYRPVLEEELGLYPNVSRRFIPRPCMQCDEPPCVPVCPVHATWMRKDGIVEIDYDKCIGCRYCITACPYSSRVFDSGRYYNKDATTNVFSMVGKNNAKEYEKEPSFDWGKPTPRKKGQSPIGNARKCHFCLHRIEKGMLPQCVVSCIGRATYFGDANDKDSLVSELIGRPNSFRLKEELGTKPKVYYLM